MFFIKSKTTGEKQGVCCVVNQEKAICKPWTHVCVDNLLKSAQIKNIYTYNIVLNTIHLYCHCTYKYKVIKCSLYFSKKYKYRKHSIADSVETLSLVFFTCCHLDRLSLHTVSISGKLLWEVFFLGFNLNCQEKQTENPQT